MLQIMKKLFLVTVCLFVVTCFCKAQNLNYFTSQQARDSITKALKNSIHQTLELPFTERYFPKYNGSYWAMQIMLYKPTNYAKKLPAQIKGLPQAPAYFQYSFLEMLYTLYPKQFAYNVKAIWHQLATSKNKALALEYLAQAALFPKIVDTSSFTKTQYYQCYKDNWNKKNKLKLPKKSECLNANFLPNEDVLISFQSNNRNIPGYLQFRTKNHTWLLNSNQKNVKHTQLARSISNLPYYLTNGNTPQGLYKIIGIDTSDNAWIGQTPNLQIRLPFEDELTQFFSNDTNYQYQYNVLLGSLQKFTQLQQTFIAGKLGRSEIIAHGTAINPNYYKHKTYYPCTPSLGCLCSPEIYNKEGYLIESHQQNFMKFIINKTIKPKWLLVIEVSDL